MISRPLLILAPLLMSPAYVVPACWGEQGYIRPIRIDHDIGPGIECDWDEVVRFDGMAAECISNANDPK